MNQYWTVRIPIGVLIESCQNENVGMTPEILIV